MTACQTDNLVPSEEERQHKALKLENSPGKVPGISHCDCSYEVESFTIDNPPTSGMGDHAELGFYADKQCTSSTSGELYFSAYFGLCAQSSVGPETDKYSGNATPGPVGFRCEVPRFDIYDLKVWLVRWFLANCGDNNPPNFTGEITYRIICSDQAVAVDFACRARNEYVSNTMVSDFYFGGGSGLINDTRVKMGVIEVLINEEPTLVDGCGCEPWIEEY